MITLGAGEDVYSREISAAGWSVNWKEKLATSNEGKDEEYSMNQLQILVYTLEKFLQLFTSIHEQEYSLQQFITAKHTDCLKKIWTKFKCPPINGRTFKVMI